MKPTMLMLLVVVLALLFFALRTFYYIRIGRGLAASAVAYSQEGIDSAPRVLVIGDSTAVGVGAATPEESLAGLLGRDFPQATIVNAGVSGAKTHELIERLKQRHGERYALVLLHIGGNDIVRGTPTTDLLRDIAEVLRLARRLSDNVVLVTSGNVGTAKLFPPGYRWLLERRTRYVRELFMNEAQQADAHYVDLFREQAHDPFARDPHRYYAADMFHPSSEGYADWYALIQLTLHSLPLH